MTDLPLADGFDATADRYLWHPATTTAILADVHLGVEHTLAAHGMPIPPVHLPLLHQAWQRLSDRLRSAGKQSRLIIAGDLFDSANPHPDTIKMLHHLLAMLPPSTAVTILPGNHDPALESLAALLPPNAADVARAATVDSYTVIHGHVFADAFAPDLPASPTGLIVGHQHPAVVLRNAVQSAKMICFAHATVRIARRKTSLIVLPTFSPAPLGTNLLARDRWILDCPPPAPATTRIAGIVRNQVLDFGPLAQL